MKDFIIMANKKISPELLKFSEGDFSRKRVFELKKLKFNGVI